MPAKNGVAECAFTHRDQHGSPPVARQEPLPHDQTWRKVARFGELGRQSELAVLLQIGDRALGLAHDFCQKIGGLLVLASRLQPLEYGLVRAAQVLEQRATQADRRRGSRRSERDRKRRAQLRRAQRGPALAGAATVAERNRAAQHLFVVVLRQHLEQLLQVLGLFAAQVFTPATARDPSRQRCRETIPPARPCATRGLDRTGGARLQQPSQEALQLPADASSLRGLLRAALDRFERLRELGLMCGLLGSAPHALLEQLLAVGGR